MHAPTEGHWAAGLRAPRRPLIVPGVPFAAVQAPPGDRSLERGVPSRSAA
ncbi:MAG TPA: hypothetical protein VFH94_17955 [Streptomyces sp.]|nr:hypothetical protein [Streptomyces sp.]